MTKGYKIGMGIIILLTAIGTFGCILNIINDKSVLNSSAKLIAFLLIIVYAAWGYKKPHGNLLKWLMIFSAVILIFSVNKAIKGESEYYAILRIIEMMMITYMAGRLDRVEQNKYIAVIILLISLFLSVKSLLSYELAELSFTKIARKISPTIIWLDLCGAYFMRYAQHKTAGLADKQIAS